jgi:2-oxoglutarate ferredoxin oxidoreductase subunit beta
LTGLLYFDENSNDLHETLNLTKKPLNQLTQEELCPGEEILKEINKGLS